MKTNVMRILDAHKIKYIERTYDENLTEATSIADVCNVSREKVFKTLVLIGNDKNHYVYVIPSYAHLNLKKAAKAFNIKNIEMIPQKDLLPLTGYVHGGCSPIGMKKSFKTLIHQKAEEENTICISGGKKGYQVELSLDDLKKIVNFTLADIIE